MAIFSKLFLHREKINSLGHTDTCKSRLSRHIQHEEFSFFRAVALAIMSERIGENDPKPVLRTDPGSPNMAADVRIFLRQIGVVFSPGRVATPTDNDRQERFYRSLKQEEVYCHDGYVSL